ncbi:MAG: hypothetical protein CSA81_10555 [Acidobacteria bacterium]|nr:MAG: hypothetical protein CSA81_10555 [Acidobacteriota bacterium]
MKLLKWIVIGLGVLFLLWIFGIFFKFLGVFAGALGAVISAFSVLLFNKSVWLAVLFVALIYLITKKKPAAGQSFSQGQTSGVNATYIKIGELDRRLDRLNDILSRQR